MWLFKYCNIRAGPSVALQIVVSKAAAGSWVILVQVAVRDEYESDSEAEEEDATAHESDENRAPNCAAAGLRSQQKGVQQQRVITLRADCSDAAGGESKASPKDTASDGGMPDNQPRSSDVSEQTSCAPPEGQGPVAGSRFLETLAQTFGRKKAVRTAQLPATASAGDGRPPEAPARTGSFPAPKLGAPRAGAAAKAPRPKRVWREGTALSAGLRLMCYCPRHTALLESSTLKARMSIVTGRPLRGLHSRNEQDAPAQRPAACDPPASLPGPASTDSGVVTPLPKLMLCGLFSKSALGTVAFPGNSAP